MILVAEFIDAFLISCALDGESSLENVVSKANYANIIKRIKNCDLTTKINIINHLIVYSYIYYYQNKELVNTFKDFFRKEDSTKYTLIINDNFLMNMLLETFYKMLILQKKNLKEVEGMVLVVAKECNMAYEKERQWNYLMSLNDKLRNVAMDTYNVAILNGAEKTKALNYLKSLCDGKDVFELAEKYFLESDEIKEYSYYLRSLIYADVYLYLIYLKENGNFQPSMITVLEDIINNEEINYKPSEQFLDNLLISFIEAQNDQEFQAKRRTLKKDETLKKANPLYFLDGLANLRF